MRLIPMVDRISRLAINQYLILDPEHLTLVDTGLPGNATNVLLRLRQLGYTPGDLKTILITHADPDHSGAVAGLVRATGARVLAHSLEARAMRSGKMSRPLKPRNWLQRMAFAFSGTIMRTHPLTCEIQPIMPGDILPIWGGLQVLDSRGHTPGHLSFYHEPSGTLFCGDSIWKKSGSPAPSSGVNCWDEDLARESFNRQMALPLHCICAGHRTLEPATFGSRPAGVA